MGCRHNVLKLSVFKYYHVTFFRQTFTKAFGISKYQNEIKQQGLRIKNIA